MANQLPTRPVEASSSRTGSTKSGDAKSPSVSRSNGSSTRFGSFVGGLFAKEATAADLERGNSEDSTRVGHIDRVRQFRGHEQPKYHNVGWIKTIFLMSKTQIGIGALAVPKVFAVLGMVPGIFVLLLVAAITGWVAWLIGIYGRRDPNNRGFNGAGRTLWGQKGAVLFWTVYSTYWTFVTASAFVALKTGLASFAAYHDLVICPIFWIALAAVVTFCTASQRTMGHIGEASMVGMALILVTLLLLTCAVAVRGPEGVDDGWKSDWKAVVHPSFADAASAISTIIFAFSGIPAYFAIQDEMKEPEQLYNRSMLSCHAIVTSLYLTVGVVVYYSCGTNLTSPALGTAGGKIEIVSYALAMVPLLVTACIVAHLPAKQLAFSIHKFCLKRRNHQDIAEETTPGWKTWYGSVTGVNVIAFLIAIIVPNFEGLIALIGAALGIPMCFMVMPLMWAHYNWQNADGHARWWQGRNKMWWFNACMSALVFISGVALCVCGSFGAIKKMINADSAHAAYTCAKFAWKISRTTPV